MAYSNSMSIPGITPSVENETTGSENMSNEQSCENCEGYGHQLIHTWVVGVDTYPFRDIACVLCGWTMFGRWQIESTEAVK